MGRRFRESLRESPRLPPDINKLADLVSDLNDFVNIIIKEYFRLVYDAKVGVLPRSARLDTSAEFSVNIFLRGFVVDRRGFEPRASAVRGRRSYH